MKYLAHIIVLIFLCGISAGLAPFIQIKGQTPNLLFLFVFVLALDKTDLDFLSLALLAGLFLDFYSGVFLGSFSLPLLAVAFAVNQTAKSLLAPEVNLKYLSLILIPAYAAFVLCFCVYGWLAKRAGLSPYFAGWSILSVKLLVSMAYNLLFLYPIFMLAGFVKSWINRHITKEYKIR